MRGLSSFDFAVIRVVPRVERGEFLNAGVIVFCLTLRFLGTRVGLDEAKLHALCPGADAAEIRKHLEALAAVGAGDSGAGPIARLSARERFHWLVAPRSTVLQISPVHSGLCESPERVLEELFERMVA